MAAPKLQKPLLVAVDTNVLLDLADGNEAVWGAVETVRRRLKGVQIVLPPTVVQELAHLIEHGATDRERTLALLAAQQLLGKWKFVPINFIPAGHGITERIADGLRTDGLLPEEEINDSFIVAESAPLERRVRQGRQLRPLQDHAPPHYPRPRPRLRRLARRSRRS